LAYEKMQRSIALLQWRHNILIISKTKTLEEANYYIELTYVAEYMLQFPEKEIKG